MELDNDGTEDLHTFTAIIHTCVSVYHPVTSPIKTHDQRTLLSAKRVNDRKAWSALVHHKRLTCYVKGFTPPDAG